MSIRHSFSGKVGVFLAGLLLTVLSVPAIGQSQENPSNKNLKDEWVVYATEIGWLRVGSRAEFSAKWQKKDEIWGGTAEEPLQKNLILEGFLTREQAVASLCGKLTKVQLRIAPPAMGAPTRTISARYVSRNTTCASPRALTAPR